MNFKNTLLINIDKSALEDRYWEKLNKLIGRYMNFSKDDPGIKSHLKDVDSLLVGFGVSVDKEIIDNAPNLKYIGVLATAYGKVDIAYAKKKGITVCNIPGYSTEAVAEFIFAALLEYIRQLEEGKIRGRKGHYSEENLKAIEIKDKTFGVIGLGNIGGRVAEIALGFGAKVIYWSRHRKKELEDKGIKYKKVESLISQSNFLSVNLAQTKDTESFFNAERIQNLKKGTIVLNTAPMELIDINALVKRLSKGDISFIFDHSDETSEEDNKRLSQFKNCIIYPPMAYITDEARIAKQEIFVGNLENFLKGSPKNIAN